MSRARNSRSIADRNPLTRAGGLIVIYEHNPAHPLTRKVVHDCEFDRDAVLLTMAQARALLENAGCADAATRSILTLPPMGGLIERLFASLPFGSQYRAIGHVK